MILLTLHTNYSIFIFYQEPLIKKFIKYFITNFLYWSYSLQLQYIIFLTYLLYYPLCSTNITQGLFLTSLTSNLHWDFYNMICDSSDFPWIFMPPSWKWGRDNFHHIHSMTMYFLILAHMAVFSELYAGCICDSLNPDVDMMTLSETNMGILIFH